MASGVRVKDLRIGKKYTKLPIIPLKIGYTQKTFATNLQQIRASV